MKIQWKVAGAAANTYTALLDTAAGDTITTFRPTHSQQPQSTKLAAVGGQTSMFRQGRGNQKSAMTLAGNKTYTNPGTALANSRTLSTSLLATNIDLQVTEVTGNAETQYYPNAAFTSIAPDVQGLSVTWSFQFESNLVTTVAP